MPDKVVLDTNVWISGILMGGLPGIVISTLEEKRASIYISPPMLEEIDRVLDHPRILNILKRSDVDKIEVLKRILSMSILVRPRVEIHVIMDDPQDNMFLECAKEGNVHYVITGDSHLKALRMFEGIEIVSPREFLDKHQQA